MAVSWSVAVGVDLNHHFVGGQSLSCPVRGRSAPATVVCCSGPRERIMPPLRSGLSCAYREVESVSDTRRSPSAAAALARAEPVSTPEVEALLDTIKWDSKGLVVAIAQHVDTGAILMQGFSNRDAISATLASRRATFYSRSRSCLWTKGETSENFINVVDVYIDCDRDSIIYLGKPEGPTCHTGAETCYFTPAFESSNPEALSTLYLLESTIASRKVEVTAKPSWTKKLVDNPRLLCSKIREEAEELCNTIEEDEGRERTISEMADLLYHSMVLCSVQDVRMEEVMAVLRGRFSESGVEEKASRKVKTPS